MRKNEKKKNKISIARDTIGNCWYIIDILIVITIILYWYFIDILIVITKKPE